MHRHRWRVVLAQPRSVLLQQRNKVQRRHSAVKGRSTKIVHRKYICLVLLVDGSFNAQKKSHTSNVPAFRCRHERRATDLSLFLKGGQRNKENLIGNVAVGSVRNQEFQKTVVAHLRGDECRGGSCLFGHPVRFVRKVMGNIIFGQVDVCPCLQQQFPNLDVAVLPTVE